MRLARIENALESENSTGVSQKAVDKMQSQIQVFETRMSLIEKQKNAEVQNSFLDELNYQKLQVDLSSKASKLDTQTIIRSILELQKDLKTSQTEIQALKTDKPTEKSDPIAVGDNWQTLY